jgi:TM2 domain-containing membrane protein YozV
MYRIIGKDGQQYGPVAAEQLRNWIADNRANAQTLVQIDGAQEWKPLAAFPEFAADLKPPLASATQPPTISLPPYNPCAAASRASNKIPAGICGILLGGLGIHKFILGYSGAGGIMLGVTLGSFVLCFVTCGLTMLGISAMHIIGLVEGIIYLTKSDEEFVRIYVDGRKEWF